MDAEFEQRWRTGRPPFDGLTVTLDDYIPLPFLQQALVAIVERLYAYRPDTALFRLLDWHEHDGVVLDARPSSWQEIRSLVASDQTLIAYFELGDTYVREGFFSAKRDYYLRLYVPDSSDNPRDASGDRKKGHYGLFDVTCPEALAAEIVEALGAVGLSRLKTIPAKAFFDNGYNG